MRGLRKWVWLAASVALTACTQMDADAARSAASVDQDTGNGTIATMKELRAVDRLSETTPYGAEACSNSSLPMSIDAHGRLYERLLEERGLQSNIEFEISPLKLAESIPERTAVLFYYSAGQTLCVWLIDSSGPSGFGHVPYDAARVEKLLKTFYRAERIEADQLSRTPQRRDASLPVIDRRPVSVPARNVLKSISRITFPGEIQQKLANYERLVIVPYGPLGTIPFAALPGPAGRALIEQSEIIIAPSLYDFYAARQAITDPFKWKLKSPGCHGGFDPDNGSTPIRSALVIGDPDFSFDPDFNMPELPGARDEAHAVAALFGQTALVGLDATLEAVLEAAPRSDLLYFATHGISYQEQGVNSFIALTRGRWAGKDVQNVCLRHVKLAVLSACQTGMGQTVEGGTITLARAFQKAGVRTVAMSLWNVEDEATRTLMTDFSARIRDGATPAAAMREATLETRKQFPLVRQWASFAVFSSHIE